MAALAIVIVVALIGFRISWVNREGKAEDWIPTEHYSMGDWVELDGAFTSDKTLEDTKGYAVRVTGAETMSYNDYIKRYGTDPSHQVDGLDAPSVVVVTMDVRNESNEDTNNGGIFIINCKLVPARKNTYFIYHAELMKESLPALEDSQGFALRKGEERTVHLPYAINSFGNDNMAFQKAITDTSFGLVMSNSPVKKIIDITL